MCASSLRTLPSSRPLSLWVEVEYLRQFVRAARFGGVGPAARLRAKLYRQLPEGALEYALMSSEEREARAGEFSASAVELVRAMEKR